LTGRLSAKEPTHVRGWRVRAWTRVGEDPNAEPQTTGYVETTTDDEGRFDLAPIAVGGLQLELKPPGELPVVADVPRSLAVRVGRADSIEIPLKSTVTVTGRFVERGTGKPVSGITVKDSAPTRPSRSQRGAATGRARARCRSRPATSR
jgi:hypothetical protein